MRYTGRDLSERQTFRLAVIKRAASPNSDKVKPYRCSLAEIFDESARTNFSRRGASQTHTTDSTIFLTIRRRSRARVSPCAAPGFFSPESSAPFARGFSAASAVARPRARPRSRPAPQKTKRICGNRGNSFVAVVEFGPRVVAKSLLAGGESGDPASPHFNDQAERSAKAQFKDVWFYREDIERHAERKYRPGD